MNVTPISFHANTNSILAMRHSNPIAPISPIKLTNPDEIQDKTIENQNQDSKTAFKGAEALANYNRAFLMSNPIKNTQIETDPVETEKQNQTFKGSPESATKTVEVDTPTFKAEEGIENLEAQKEKAKL